MAAGCSPGLLAWAVRLGLCAWGCVPGTVCLGLCARGCWARFPGAALQAMTDRRRRRLFPSSRRRGVGDDRDAEVCFGHPSREVRQSWQSNADGSRKMYARCRTCDKWLYWCDARGKPLDLRNNRSIVEFMRSNGAGGEKAKKRGAPEPRPVARERPLTKRSRAPATSGDAES